MPYPHFPHFFLIRLRPIPLCPSNPNPHRACADRGAAVAGAVAGVVAGVVTGVVTGVVAGAGLVGDGLLTRFDFPFSNSLTILDRALPRSYHQ